MNKRVLISLGAGLLAVGVAYYLWKKIEKKEPEEKKSNVTAGDCTAAQIAGGKYQNCSYRGGKGCCNVPQPAPTGTVVAG